MHDNHRCLHIHLYCMHLHLHHYSLYYTCAVKFIHSSLFHFHLLTTSYLCIDIFISIFTSQASLMLLSCKTVLLIISTKICLKRKFSITFRLCLFCASITRLHALHAYQSRAEFRSLFLKRQSVVEKKSYFSLQRLIIA